jgi:hypothetical protein
LETYAGWNVISAALTGYFGARLLTGATRRMLDASAAWAVLSVVVGVVQIGNGATNDIFVLSILAAGAAGILSFVARNAISQAVPPPPVPATPPATSAPPATAAAAPGTPPPPAPAAWLAPTATASPARQMGTVVTPTYLVREAFVDPAEVPASVPAATPPPPVVDAPAPDLIGSPPAVSVAASDAAMKPTTARRGPIIAVVVAVAVIAAAFAGFALLSGGAGPFAAASPTPTVTPTPTPFVATPIPFNGTGVITFGKSYNPETLEIIEPATSFKASTTSIAWSAALTGPFGVPNVTYIISSKSASGDESTVYTENLSISNTDADTIAGTADLASLVDRKVGTYAVRIVRLQDLVAEGTFKLTK